MLGIRNSVVAALFRKEAREVLRDRRTLLMTLVVPAALYPLLMMVLAELTTAATLSLQTRPITVAVARDVPADVVSALRAAERVEVSVHPEPQAAVQERSARAGVDVMKPQTPDAEAGLRLYVDAAQDDSRVAGDRLEQIFAEVRKERLRGRLARLGVTESYVRPLPVKRTNTSTPERMKSYVASRLLPFLLIVLSLAGATATAVDTTAGERERGTLLTLMSTPVTAGEVAFSKLAIVTVVALIAGLANMVSLAATLALTIGKNPDFRLELTPALFFGSTMALIPTALYGAALLLGLAALGKSTREAQTATAPALFLCLGLAAVAVVPGVEATVVLNALPIAGPALLMRDLMMDEATLEQILTVMAASLVSLWLMMTFAARILMSEPMLSSHLSAAAVLRDLSGARRPTTLTASMMGALLLVVTVYLGRFLQSIDLPLGLLATQLLLFAASIGLLRALRLDALQIAGARSRPALRGLLSGLLLGLSVSLPLILLETVMVRLAGMEEALEQMERVFREVLGTDLTYASAFLLIGVLPGIFEELAFRGGLQGVLLRVTRPSVAIVTQAAVFALAHQSVLRFPPTFLLGLLLGTLRWRTASVWPGIVLHTIHNGLLALLLVASRDLPESADADIMSAIVEDAPMFAAMIAALFLGTVLLWRSRPPAREQG